jgi:tripartite motif-containing protein 56
VTVRDGTQYWTVPCTGKYEIKTVGAAGGYDRYGSTARGRGAYMRGEFELNKGDVLKILVGQEGGINSRSQSSGGGGGTFVATSSNTPVIIAGGGGGIENLQTRLTRCDASTETSGRKNQCKNSCMYYLVRWC